MTRRIIKESAEMQGSREASPAVKRHFAPGTVLNILQWTQPEVARFTVEGEGAEVWFCARGLMEHVTLAAGAEKGSPQPMVFG